MPFSKYISLIQLICAIVSILLITSLVIGVTRVGFYGAAAMAFSICKNREFYFAISGNPILQFPVKLVYNKQAFKISSWKCPGVKCIAVGEGQNKQIFL